MSNLNEACHTRHCAGPLVSRGAMQENARLALAQRGTCQMSHVTHEWMSHESWVMSYTWMRHGLHLNKSWVIFEWDTNRLWRSHGSHTVCYEGVCRVRLLSLAPMNESWAIGWLRLVGSLKLLVSFAEYRLFHRALLQKRPVIWSSFTGLFCKRDLWFEGVYCM